MYQAITTKYFGPTNARGSRVKATAAAGSITLHWDNALNIDQNHTAAAKALANKMGWTGNWHGGCDHNGCFVYVLITINSSMWLDHNGFVIAVPQQAVA